MWQKNYQILAITVSGLMKSKSRIAIRNPAYCRIKEIMVIRFQRQEINDGIKNYVV